MCKCFVYLKSSQILLKKQNLRLCFGKVGTDAMDGVSFVVVKDLLYRDFLKSGIMYRTLVVRKPLKEQVLSYAHEVLLAVLCWLL